MTFLNKYFYGLVVFSSAMLATWTLGEVFSVGGFTTTEITLLMLFSSAVLIIAPMFWNAVIGLAMQLLRIKPVALSSVTQP